jgi:ketosteroid isomerase-like protein
MARMDSDLEHTESVGAFLERLAQSVNAGRAHELDVLLAREAVAMFPDSPPAYGRKAVLELLSHWMRAYRHQLDYELCHVAPAGPLCYADGTFTLRSARIPSGSVRVHCGSFLFVLRHGTDAACSAGESNAAESSLAESNAAESSAAGGWRILRASVNSTMPRARRGSL